MAPLQHFNHQRLSAILLTFLIPWFVIAIAPYAADLEVLNELISNAPLKVTGILLLGIIALYHAYLGLEVIIEDYVPQKKLRYLLIQTLSATTFVVSVYFIVCLFSLSFTG